MTIFTVPPVVAGVTWSGFVYALSITAFAAVFIGVGVVWYAIGHRTNVASRVREYSVK